MDLSSKKRIIYDHTKKYFIDNHIVEFWHCLWNLVTRTEHVLYS